MNEKLPYWGSVVFSAVALVILVINVSLATINHAAQIDINQRQNTVMSGQSLDQLNKALVQMMAQAAVKENDTKMRDLLSSQGITLKSEPASAAKPTDKK